MYKEKGRNNYQVYSVDMSVNVFNRVVMEKVNFNAHWLELEVTETQVMKNPEHSLT